MRKLLSTIIIFIIAFVCANSGFADEIQFRGIPWLSSLSEVQASFGGEVPIDAVEEFQMLLVNDLNGDYSNINEVSHVEYPSGWIGICPASFYDVSVAGYPLDEIDIYCSYDVEDGIILKNIGSSKFYLAAYRFNVSNVEEAYSDLQQKMSSLYGEGEIANNDYEYFTGDVTIDRTTTWNGDSNTKAVLAYRGFDDASGSFSYAHLWLTYSTSDADDLIKTICQIQSGDELNRIDQNRSNTDGL
ncbi:MAG: hypothetical protein IJ214_10125 [Clostridia bacterium]|nr:hypothetical protein [Clostridia bacterium]